MIDIGKLYVDKENVFLYSTKMVIKLVCDFKG